MFPSCLMHHTARSTTYPVVFLILLMATSLMSPWRAFLDLSNVALLYVLAVVLAGARYGRGVAIFTALCGSFLFAYVFVPPHFSLAITDIQYILAAVIMLVVALLVGRLTANLRTHVEMVEAQAARNRSLYEFARQLTATRSTEAVIETSLHFLEHAIGVQQARFVASNALDSPAEQAYLPLYRAALEQRRLMVFPQQALAVLPLRTLEAEQGMLCFVIDPRPFASQLQQEFMETIGSLIAVALERTHYLEVARETEVRRAAERLRNTILASLSHDIRTPLTALVGTADTLIMAQALPRETQCSLLDGLREQALSIYQFVNNLLDMAKLQSGHAEPNLAWQPIEEVVGATLQQIRTIAAGRAFRLTMAEKLPPVRIDATLMERALWNLLENALKYAPPEAPIDLDIRQAGGYIEIAIADRGPGLPPGDNESLFGLFQRGQSESNVPGAGIGLAIVKNIAEIHQGNVWAVPREGGGSSFYLSLPVGQPPDINFGEDA